MNTEHLLKSLAADLDSMKERFIELARQSEFQEKRDEYIKYSQEIVHIKNKIEKDYDNVSDMETYTGILDRI